MRSAFLLLAAGALLACGGGGNTKAVDDAGTQADGSSGEAGAPIVRPARLSLEELQNPETCAGCHPKQYKEWASSMHAYASVDPVFLAMNKRGQRETNGELGDFCVKCHAPMALRNGLTTNGLDLAELPKAAQGVTCYFCHNATGHGPGDLNNGNVLLANDDVMRGSIRDAVDPGVHGVSYSEAHNNRKMAASQLCGSCHDIRNPKGADIERTFQEYAASINSIDRAGNQGGDTCQGCHMQVLETTKIASVPDSMGLALRERDRHNHMFPAVDIALTDFPDRELHRQATDCALSEDGAFIFELTHDGQGGFNIALETAAGHAQPSGATIDRRMWLEVIAYDAANNVLFQSGVIGPTEVEEYPLTDERHDPQLCMFRDHWEDENGKEVHQLWEPAKKRELDSKLLPMAINFGANHVANCPYQTPGRQVPARLTVRLLMRPVGMDVLNDLVSSGDLDPAILEEMPTFEIHTASVEWTPDKGRSIYMPLGKPMPDYCER